MTHQFWLNRQTMEGINPNPVKPTENEVKLKRGARYAYHRIVLGVLCMPKSVTKANPKRNL